MYSIKPDMQAEGITIITDSCSILHIYETDAGAEFGLMYAQCEEKLDRRARIDDAELHRDLLSRLL